jgi:hypothetical protein
VVVQELVLVAASSLTGLLETVQGAELVEQHVVLNVGEEEADLRLTLVLLTHLGQVAADELEPQSPLALQLLPLTVHPSLQ